MATDAQSGGRSGAFSLDAAGAALSSLCLVHCLALPLLALALPTALGAATHHHGDDLLLHLLLIGAALPVSLLAFRRGLRRHGHALPLALGGTGFALMLAGALVHGAAVQVLTVAGGLMVAGGHLLNWRARPAA